ncbi:response regulator [Fundidesulfovibrio soli]|uniref:response regulator n=1 Tax=Fundidesulfovibrio soli TaxID=2922716 RepID=UPI001FAFE08D|nr:response regulator [Fundidesulfovibrio soli]
MNQAEPGTGTQAPPGKTILTVDDDIAVRSTLVAWIEDAGYTAVEAGSGIEGLVALTSSKPDLVLLDLRMPVMDGLAFLEEKRRLGNDTPVIVISGRADIQDAIHAFRLGAWDYIIKPIESFELLAHAVSVVLERRDLTMQVRRAEARYSNLVHNIPLMIFSLDDRLDVQFVNSACTGMLGFTPEEARSQAGWFLERIHPEDRERVRGSLEQRLRDSSYAFSKTCRMLRKSGRVVHGIIKSIPSPACGTTCERPQVEGVVLDITDRLMLEKYLVQKEKVKTLGAISAEVAHEIRNPLVSIAGYARRLVKNLPDSAEAQVILDEAQRLERILDRIRDYLSPVTLHREACDLGAIAGKCLELLSPELEANGVAPRFLKDIASATVEEDAELLTQVVINLIRSTLANLPPKGGMWLRTFESERFLHLEVCGGQTAPVPDVDKVFLPFDEGGETIGLPFCHRLLRTMGGSLTFEQKDNVACFVMSVQRAQRGHPERSNPPG